MTLSEGMDIQQPEDVFQDAYKSLNQTLEQSQPPVADPSICTIPASIVPKGSTPASQIPSVLPSGERPAVSTDSTAAAPSPAAEKEKFSAPALATLTPIAEKEKFSAPALATLTPIAEKEKFSAPAPATLTPIAEKGKVSVAPNESKVPATRNEDKASEDTKRWFVMRDLKRANAKMPAYKQFMEAGIEVFTPMHTIRKSIDGKTLNVQEPFIRDLLFVHETRRVIDPVVDITPTIQYRYERGKGYKVPMVVRDTEMDRFILAVTGSGSPKFFTPEEIIPSMLGRSVRITGGTLEGYTGKLLKISGSRTKRLLVQIEGILAAGIEVETRYVEML